jgi:hypothetical protein
MVLFSKPGDSIVSCCLHMLGLLFRFVGCFEIIDSEKQQQPVAGLSHDRGSSRKDARARCDKYRVMLNAIFTNYVRCGFLASH